MEDLADEILKLKSSVNLLDKYVATLYENISIQKVETTDLKLTLEIQARHNNSQITLVKILFHRIEKLEQQIKELKGGK